MTTDDILALWDEDSQVDTTELGSEALKISSLHAKYYRLFVRERLAKRKMDHELRELRLAKHEFYLHGPSRESEARGWKPAALRVLKSDLPTYVDGDRELSEAVLKIGYVQEKIDLLESIIKVINNRNYALKTALDFIKFTNGAH